MNVTLKIHSLQNAQKNRLLPLIAHVDFFLTMLNLQIMRLQRNPIMDYGNSTVIRVNNSKQYRKSYKSFLPIYTCWEHIYILMLQSHACLLNCKADKYLNQLFILKVCKISKVAWPSQMLTSLGLFRWQHTLHRPKQFQ